MIKGIGIDLIEIKRIKDKVHEQRFINRILTKKEQEHYDRYTSDKRKAEFLAGRFAAKEAYAKALGSGIGKIGFLDIEVLNDDKGAPYINIFKPGGQRIFVSISHSEAYAVAQVVIEG